MSSSVKSRAKIIIILVILLLLGSAVTYYYKKNKNVENQQVGHAPQVVVRVAEVASRDLPTKIDAVGSLEAINSIVLAPEMTGLIKQINFKDGDEVTEGEVLFEIGRTSLLSNLDAAKAELRLSEMEYNRAKQLVESKAIAAQSLDKARSDFKQKRALLQMAQSNVDKSKIVAPFSGRLGNRKVSQGQYVTPGQSLVELVDRQHLKISYAVSETYLANLHIGQEVEFTTSAYPEHKFDAKVTYVAPTINIDDRTIILQAEVENQDNLLTPGLFVKVSQILGIAQGVLSIPTQSLVATIDGNKVFKVEDGSVREVAVEVGTRNNQFIQITKGLQQGDKIVVQGQHKLKDGAAIKIVD